ncbi:MAG: long-chain-fatty-acid--CoA ligase [Proteobacteria bacterium]|nr:long-chain-fatty-acid--CoA ligase [Pseudomonadota bacterium]
MDKPWLQSYPSGVPAQVDVDRYATLADLLEQAYGRHAAKEAYVFMGKRWSFADVDRASAQFAAYLQHELKLAPGDRVAVMMPNVPQYPVAVAGVLRAGMVLVSVNPLYTPRELEHQLKDSGAKAIVILENFAHTLEQVRARVPTQHVVLTAMGDLLGTLKGGIVNLVVRHVKKLVPAFDLPGAVRWNAALARGATLPRYSRPPLTGDDIAVLQYTGGTTGVSKGAVLLNRNMVANVMQAEAWFQPGLRKVPPDTVLTAVAALPLYHIFGLTVNLLLWTQIGGRNVLIPNPRDLPATFKALSTETVHCFPAVNTLFAAMLNHPQFNTVNWRNLLISVGGGMSVQQITAKRWLEATGCAICEGYGLSETSPVASCNATDATAFTGSIGLPVPNTDMALLDDAGAPVPQGERGEIAIRGPQVMAGYWQRPDETAKVMTADGFFRTGDIGTMDEKGYFRIVDRKKDMILVSGFNVYPNEVEEVISQMPGVLECAAVGVPDERTGEAVKIVIVKKDQSLTEATVKAWAHDNLTGYKRPHIVEFRTELPKTPVGKILRRELRG